jgi:hypothetical protein
MEMVTAMPVSVNAHLIMSMQKTARIMDVSTYRKLLCFFLLSNEMTMYTKVTIEKSRSEHGIT